MKKWVFYMALSLMVFAAAFGQTLPPTLPETKIVQKVRKKKKDPFLKTI
ncbi:MAG: hypothetical protein JNL70_15175 [Saprospiraceae bacterium]|nr:hypothetical protein [Saprospiraceae bacterium]